MNNFLLNFLHHYARSLFLLIQFCVLFVCFSLQSKEELYNPQTLFLTWDHQPESTIVIRWITNQNETTDLVQYQQEGDLSWSEQMGSHSPMPNQFPFFIHSVELTNLTPNTAYYFRIGSNGSSLKFRTLPETLEESNVRFVEGGDVYHDTAELIEKTNHQAALTSPHFALLGGDLAYASARHNPNRRDHINRWIEWLTIWKRTMITPDGCLIPLIVTVGNHDTAGGFDQTPPAARIFYALFRRSSPAGYQAIDFSNYMSLYLLDSGHTNPVAGKQTEWLFKMCKMRLGVPVQFAAYHVPAYPSAHGFASKRSSAIRTNWCPIFDDFDLNAAFEHHEHTYKRTYPLKNGIEHPNGVLYIGDGAWGVAKLRKPLSTIKAPYLAKAISTNHFIFVNISENRVNYQAIDMNGKVIDTFYQEVRPK